MPAPAGCGDRHLKDMRGRSADTPHQTRGLALWDGAFAPYERFAGNKTSAQGQSICPGRLKYRRVEAAKGRQNPKRKDFRSEVLSFWYARLDSNQWPTESESVTLSN